MREFRRATVAMALLALACAPKLREPGPALARTARVQLTPASADVWASSIRVTASAEGGSELARCAVVGGSGERELARSGSGFSASVALAPGQNSFFARCDDGRGHRVRSEPVVYTVPLTTNPVARIRARMHGEQLVLDGAPSASNEFSAAPLRKFSWSRQDARDRAPAASSAGPELRPTALPGDSDVIYELSVEDAMGRTDVARTQVRVRSGRFELPRPAPLWLDDAVVYGVIPPLYGTEPLKGVRRALRPLAELGVSAIWLSPIFTTPEGDFGYAVKDYFSVRADYGTEQDLKDLADEAHALGLRVLLDFVPNHTSTEHRYFEQARELGK